MKYYLLKYWLLYFILTGPGYSLPEIIANDQGDRLPTPKVMVPYLHKVQTPQGMHIASKILVYYGGIEKYTYNICFWEPI